MQEASALGSICTKRGAKIQAGTGAPWRGGLLNVAADFACPGLIKQHGGEVVSWPDAHESRGSCRGDCGVALKRLACSRSHARTLHVPVCRLAGLGRRAGLTPEPQMMRSDLGFRRSPTRECSDPCWIQSQKAGLDPPEFLTRGSLKVSPACSQEQPFQIRRSGVAALPGQGNQEMAPESHSCKNKTFWTEKSRMRTMESVCSFYRPWHFFFPLRWLTRCGLPGMHTRPPSLDWQPEQAFSSMSQRRTTGFC